MRRHKARRRPGPGEKDKGTLGVLLPTLVWAGMQRGGELRGGRRPGAAAMVGGGVGAREEAVQRWRRLVELGSEGKGLFKGVARRWGLGRMRVEAGERCGVALMVLGVTERSGARFAAATRRLGQG